MVVLSGQLTEVGRGAVILEAYLQRLVDERTGVDVLATLTYAELDARARADDLDADVFAMLDWLMTTPCTGNGGYVFCSSVEYDDDDEVTPCQSIPAIARWFWHVTARGESASTPARCLARLVSDSGYGDIVTEALATWPTTPMSPADGRVLLDAVARSGSMRHATELADHGIHVCTHPLLLEECEDDMLNKMHACMYNRPFMIEWLLHCRTDEELTAALRTACYEPDFDFLALAIEADASDSLMAMLGVSHDGQDMREGIFELPMLLLMSAYWRRLPDEMAAGPSVDNMYLEHGSQPARNWSLAFLSTHLANTSFRSNRLGAFLRWLVNTGPPRGDEWEVREFMQVVVFLARNDLDDLASLEPIANADTRPLLEDLMTPTPWRTFRERRRRAFACVRCAERV